METIPQVFSQRGSFSILSILSTDIKNKGPIAYNEAAFEQ